MPALFACLSTGKGTWGHVSRVIDGEEWDKVVLLTNDFGKDKFSSEKEVELIVVDVKQPMDDLVKKIASELKEKVKDAPSGTSML